MNIDLTLGDCLEVLKTIPDNSVDAVITDPPYGLNFMGKKWDYDVPSTKVWSECLRVLKPGGHLLSFGGSRTYHRMAVAVEDAGFEIRDQIIWCYGSGFPKSLNIGKAIDKRGGEQIGWFGEWLKKWREENNIPQSKIAELFPSKTGGLTGCVSNWELGSNLPTNEQFNLICETFDLPFKSLEEAEREFIGTKTSGIGKAFTKDGWGSGHDEVEITKGNGKWEGWGTALKPAHEPMVLGQKEGGEELEIDVPFVYKAKASKKDRNEGTNELYLVENNLLCEIETLNELLRDTSVDMINIQEEPEWNTISFGNNITEQYQMDFKSITSIILKMIIGLKTLNYSPHLSTKDYIVDAIKMINKNGLNLVDYAEFINQLKQNITNEVLEYRLGVVSAVLPTLLKIKEKGKTGNFHATVKPTDLMRYLINLITPPNGTILDPFMGSGSTGKAAVQCGVNFIGIEKEEEYFNIAKARIEHEKNKPVQTKLL